MPPIARSYVNRTSETTKCESKPGGGKFLDRVRLVLLEERQNEDCAQGRQPGDDGKNVQVFHN